VDWLDHGVGIDDKKAIDQMRTWNRLGLRPALAFESVQSPAKANVVCTSSNANHTTSFFIVRGFGSGAYSEKLLADIRQRLSGSSRASAEMKYSGYW
jgi:hypothetical protein